MDTPINVILLTVESLRADRFTEDVAPKFFKAAQEALHFRKHRSIASWTAPNIISLLTGISPFVQGVHARGHSIAAGLDTALEKIARSGWEIGSIQSFARMENFHNLGMPVAVGETIEHWIAQKKLAGKPFVFWHHYLDTHLPYAPDLRFLANRARLPQENEPAFERIQAVRQQPAIRAGSIKFEETDRPYIDLLYEGGIRQFDDWFDNFWQFFKAAGLREDTVLIVTADHGEELLERRNIGHASTTMAGTLFEELVRVPLFIWWPQQLSAGLVDRPSDHLDIMPTVLEALGLRGQEAFPGKSLTRSRRSDRWYAVTSKAGFAEADPNAVEDFIAAVAKDRWKLVIKTKGRELINFQLYDLLTDPQEYHNRAKDRPDIVSRMLPSLTDRLAKLVIPQRGTGQGLQDDGRAAPKWVYPAESQLVSWDDLQGHLFLEWTGIASSYVIEYTAGLGALSVSGQFFVNGLRKDFGIFSRNYWETWIVPYRQVVLRVRNSGDTHWSETLTIKLKK